MSVMPIKSADVAFLPPPAPLACVPFVASSNLMSVFLFPSFSMYGSQLSPFGTSSFKFSFKAIPRGCPRCLNGGQCAGLYSVCRCPSGWAGKDCSRKTCTSDGDCQASAYSRRSLRPFTRGQGFTNLIWNSGPQM